MTSAEQQQKIAAARDAIRTGNLDAAAAIAADLLAKAPETIDALEIAALVQLQRGEDLAAERTLRAAISVDPQRRWHYADLGRLLLKLGRRAEAEELTRGAIAADPQNADAHAMLAWLVADREQWFEAAGHLRTAIGTAGPHPDLLTGLGRALLRLGQLDGARTSLEAAAAAAPDALEPAVYLAEVEERSGHFHDAERHLDRADGIARRQGTDVDLQRSVLLARMGRSEEALAILDSREELSGTALLQRGRLREQARRFDEAWDDWTTGKSKIALTSGRRYAAEAVRSKGQWLANFFSSPAAAELSRAGQRTDVPQPIFIIGFPRSGTTLVEQILACHTRIRAGGELPFGPEIGETAVVLADGERALRARLADPRCGESFRDVYLDMAARYGLLEPGSSHFTDKMPDNAFWLPLLRMAFPEAPVILVRRHPLDILTSVLAHDMTHGFNCSYRPEDAARHLALVDGLLERYGAAAVGPTYELRYESLVADQAGETERLMAAVGLPMEAAQMSFHERSAVPATPSYAQVKQPLNDRSIGRWRKFAVQLEAVRPIVAVAIARGGYEA